MTKEIAKYSWEQIENVFDELAGKIKASRFEPDYIVGITNGGLIPLYYIAKKLKGFEHVLTVSGDSYEKDQKKEFRILYMPEIDLQGKKILLVDEIADTGETLKEISDAMMAKYKIGELKIATLAVNTERCQFYPDFHVIEEKVWVVFPWEKDDFPEYFA